VSEARRDRILRAAKHHLAYLLHILLIDLIKFYVQFPGSTHRAYSSLIVPKLKFVS